MDAIVTTKNGRIRGLKKTSQLGAEYYSFQGIPFAEPPVGDLRFKSPVPAAPWEGVLEAVTEKPVPHYVESHFPGLETNEDCLYLNVYSKTISTADKKPVLVFIYGGGFSGGSSTTKMYGPDFLMQEDAILVTFNYRLCIFGHLAFKDPSLGIPGNAFLKDQRLALRWIKDNIEAFGGDPENITVFGHSAGGISLHLHLLSPSCEGLFCKAIVLAGVALLPKSTIPMLPVGERLALNTGWNGEGSERGVYEHLMRLDADTLTKASAAELLTTEERMAGYISAFTPIIEPYETEESFCSKEPLEAMRSSWGNNIDAIFWYGSNEMILGLKGLTQVASMGSPPDGLFLPHDLKVKHATELGEATKKIKALYDLEHLRSENVQPLLDYKNDEIFFHPTHRTILSRLKYATKNTYLGYFDLESETFNHHKICVFKAQHLRGAAHGDELSYIFANEFPGPLPSMDTNEFSNVMKMVDFLVGFAREGPKKLEKMLWKPIMTADNYEALLIRNTEWKMGVLSEASRLAVWDELYGDDLI